MKKTNRVLCAIALVAAPCFTGCQETEAKHEAEPRKVVVTAPAVRDVVQTQQYVCQIHSCRHIELRALDSGYLKPIQVKEGQEVTEGDVLFDVVPILYKAQFDAAMAEVDLAKIDLGNQVKLFQDGIVSDRVVALAQARLDKAEARMELARAKMNFTEVKAPFTGIMDRLHMQQGSLVEEGDILTTLSDNSVMWVYFNVPEARYLEYKAELEKQKDQLRIELVLANGQKFPYPGVIGAIEADFNNETGNIAFRADFPNPSKLLRHGQTGTIYVSRVTKDSVVIPQRSTYEILAKKYVYVVEDAEKKAKKSAAEPAGQEAGEDKTAQTKRPRIEAKKVSDHGDAEHEESEYEGAEHEGAKHEGAKHGAGGHGATPDWAKGANVGRGVARQREIVIGGEQDDIFLIAEGLTPDDRIVFEGIREVRDGEELEYEFRSPDQILSNLKFKAE